MRLHKNEHMTRERKRKGERTWGKDKCQARGSKSLYAEQRNEESLETANEESTVGGEA